MRPRTTTKVSRADRCEPHRVREVLALPRLAACRSARDRRQELQAARGHVVSTHAADELEDDNPCIPDLGNIILTRQIVERQRDCATRETKYVIQGATLEGSCGEGVAKVGLSGKLVIITVYVS